MQSYRCLQNLYEFVYVADKKNKNKRQTYKKNCHLSAVWLMMNDGLLQASEDGT